jgi:signal transduction histidine kinase
LRRSRRQLIAAHERVRQDIAARLLDGVQENFLLLKGHLREVLNGNGSASETSRDLRTVMDGLNQKIEQQVGVLSNRLYPSILGAGLVPALQSFRDRFGTALDVEIERDEVLENEVGVDPHLLPEPVRLAAYRIVEEALTNVIEHTKASKATVRLDSSREGWLRLTVRDNGEGFDVENTPRGLGMQTMQNYAEAVDGECSVHSDPGAGTEIAAVLPLSLPGAGRPESSEQGDN